VTSGLGNFYRNLSQTFKSPKKQDFRNDISSLTTLDKMNLGLVIAFDPTSNSVRIKQEKKIDNVFYLFLLTQDSGTSTPNLLKTYLVYPARTGADSSRAVADDTAEAVPQHRECSLGNECLLYDGRGPDKCDGSPDSCKERTILSCDPHSRCESVQVRGNLWKNECDKDGEDCDDPDYARHCDDRTKKCELEELRENDAPIEENCDVVGEDCNDLACNSQGQCVLSAALPPGSDLSGYINCASSTDPTEPDTDKCRYHACNSDKVCEARIGKPVQGEILCEPAFPGQPDPCAKHLACEDGLCVSKPDTDDGKNENECSRVSAAGVEEDPQCSYHACRGVACALIFAPNPNGTKGNCDPYDPLDDCSHKKCLYGTEEEYPFNAQLQGIFTGEPLCGLVEGEDESITYYDGDACLDNGDCPPTPTPTPVPRSSSSKSSASSRPGYHKACVDLLGNEPGPICQLVPNGFALGNHVFVDSCRDSFDCPYTASSARSSVSSTASTGSQKSTTTTTTTLVVVVSSIAPSSASASSQTAKTLTSGSASSAGKVAVLMQPSTELGVESPSLDLAVAKAQFAFDSKNRPIRIEVFQDLKCGMCKHTFEDTIENLIANEVKNGEVELIFKEFPLGMRDEEKRLAIAAKCAGKQNQYLDFVRNLYKNAKTSSKEDIMDYAQELDLDLVDFSICLNDASVEKSIELEVAEGQKLGIKGTPTFVIAGKVYPGAKSYSTFQRLLQGIH
jgi:protein-disulfide isomerase